MPFVKPANLKIIEGPNGAECMLTQLDLTLILPQSGGIEIPVELGVLGMHSEERPEHIPKDGNYFKLTTPSIELADHYVHMERLIAICAQKGEEVNRLFARLNNGLFCHDMHGENRLILQKTIDMLDFMTLKNLILDYIKNSVQFKHLISKEFRKGLDDFIICRNIFTHGKLRIAMPPGDVLCIEYIGNHSKVTEFMLVDMNTIREYNQAAVQIKRFADEFNRELVKQKGSTIATQGASCRLKTSL